jgi:hypothetical protein
MPRQTSFMLQFVLATCAARATSWTISIVKPSSASDRYFSFIYLI